MKTLLGLLFICCFAKGASAMEAILGPVEIHSLSLVVVPHAGHLAGNFELVLKGGFSPPTGMNCDPDYITTKKEVDPDHILFPFLASAYLSGQPIMISVTDDPAYRAFGRRCSLTGAHIGAPGTGR